MPKSGQAFKSNSKSPCRDLGAGWCPKRDPLVQATVMERRMGVSERWILTENGELSKRLSRSKKQPNCKQSKMKWEKVTSMGKCSY